MIKELFNFLDSSRTAFNAVDNLRKELLENKYIELKENNIYKIKKGGKYFVCRNNSSIMAFNIGKKLDNPALHICASHTDCPTFKLKPHDSICSNGIMKLDVEPYGGVLLKTWFDRPLSLAGRVEINEKGNVKEKIVDLKKPLCVIPSLAPHAGSIDKLNPQIDLLPIISQDKGFDLKEYIANSINVKKENLISYDLYLYPCCSATTFGPNDEFFASQHIDNLESCYLSFKGFLNNFNDNNINVFVSFDNEEVGSLTYQGAESDFMVSNIQRICTSLNIDYCSLKSNGMMLSIDNAHAFHPNHPELYDLDNCCRMNGGVVIKYNARQLYTSQSLSSALFMNLLNKNKVPYQVFANRSDNRGGSTLGNISNSQLSILSIDIGLAQLAMHSCFEEAGIKDIDYMYKTCKAFYKAHFHEIKDNTYSL